MLVPNISDSGRLSGSVRTNPGTGSGTEPFPARLTRTFGGPLLDSVTTGLAEL